MRKTLGVYSEDERTTSKLRGLVAKINKEFINSPTPFIVSCRKKAFKRSGIKKNSGKLHTELKSPLKTPPNRFKRRK